MDELDLESMMSAVSLTEEEQDVTVVGDALLCNTKDLEALVLIGKVISSKQVSKEGLRAAMRKAWGRDFSIAEMGRNIFSFAFDSEKDSEMVLRKGPWNFEHSLVVIQPVDGTLQPSVMQFSHAKFWVRLYNLPFLCRSREIVSIIGGKIGDVVDVDMGMNGDGLGKFIRVRVIIDISKSLKRGVKVGLANNTAPIWIPVSYERLPDFCFECRCIGHSFKDCSVFLNLSIENRGVKRPYGSWLRANNVTSRENSYTRIDDRNVVASSSSASRPVNEEVMQTLSPGNQRLDTHGLVDVPIISSKPCPSQALLLNVEKGGIDQGIELEKNQNMVGHVVGAGDFNLQSSCTRFHAGSVMGSKNELRRKKKGSGALAPKLGRSKKGVDSGGG
ncbi:hypothetical protein LguiA_016550 [Lonicera macranthoides]